MIDRGSQRMMTGGSGRRGAVITLTSIEPRTKELREGGKGYSKKHRLYGFCGILATKLNYNFASVLVVEATFGL